MTPKTVALGTGGTAVSVAGGVAIEKGMKISNKDTKNAEEQKDKAPQKDTQTNNEETIEKKLTDAHFVITKNNDTCTDEKLKNKYDSSKEDEYKEIAVNCSSTKTFAERAKQLKLTTLNTDHIESGADQSKWNAKWTKQQEDIKKLDESKGASWDSIAKAKEKVKEECSKSFSKTTKTTDWHKYIKICVEEDSDSSNKLSEALKKDFWTNDPIANLQA